MNLRVFSFGLLLLAIGCASPDIPASPSAKTQDLKTLQDRVQALEFEVKAQRMDLNVKILELRFEAYMDSLQERLDAPDCRFLVSLWDGDERILRQFLTDAREITGQPYLSRRLEAQIQTYLRVFNKQCSANFVWQSSTQVEK